MSMNLIQFQSGLSIPKLFKQFGIKALCKSILEKALGSQSFSCSQCDGTAPRFVHNIFQCRSRRHQTSLRFSVLLKSTKLSLTIWILGIYLINQTWTSLSALALKHQLGISYLSSWLFEFKFMDTMAECEALCCSVQIDDTYFGSEFRSSHVDRGSENKICFVAAVSLNDEGHPLQVKLTPAPFIADGAKYNLSFGCLMLSVGLARFDAVADADCPHRPISIDRGNPKYFPHFVWINNLLVRLKTSLGGVYHAFDFNNYASRCPVPFPNCFTLRFDPKTFRECLLLGAIVISPQADARLRSAEAAY